MSLHISKLCFIIRFKCKIAIKFCFKAEDINLKHSSDNAKTVYRNKTIPANKSNIYQYFVY